MEYKTLTLSQSAQFDKGANHPTTMWANISFLREKNGISRKQRIRRGEGKRGGLIQKDGVK